MNRIIRTSKCAILTMLMLAMTMFSTLSVAQESLIDLISSGERKAALAAIGSSDVNAAAADGSTALLWATYTADQELVDALLEAGADADITNKYGSTPLTEAVKLSNLELTRALLAAGADPDSPNLDNQTVLMIAATQGSLDIVELLLENDADINAVESFRGQTALMWAAAENYPEITELLVEQGADVSVRAVHDDWQRQMTSEPRAQFRATGGLTALLYAARSGCYRCAVAIVEAGADINQPNPDGITPLINAIDNKSFDIAMYLIDQGANVSVWDMNGRTPFYLAIDMNSFVPRGFFGAAMPERAPTNVSALELAERLIGMGVDVNHQLTRMRPNGPGRGRFADYMMRNGTGPLLLASMNYDLDSVALLLANGAEVELHNAFKITPLMAASGMSGNGRAPSAAQGPNVEERAIATIDLLLAAGADINARIVGSRTYTGQLDTYIQGRDLEGQNVLFPATERGWAKVVAHLIENGADPSALDADGNTAVEAARLRNGDTFEENEAVPVVLEAIQLATNQ